MRSKERPRPLQKKEAKTEMKVKERSGPKQKKTDT